MSILDSLRFAETFTANCFLREWVELLAFVSVLVMTDSPRPVAVFHSHLEKTCSVNSFIAFVTENIDVKQLLMDPRQVRWFCAALVCSKYGSSHHHPAGAPRSYSSTAESSPQQTYTGNYTDLLILDMFNTFSFNSDNSTNGLLLNPAQLFWIKPWSTLSERVVTAVMQVNALQCWQLLSDCFLAAN